MPLDVGKLERESLERRNAPAKPSSISARSRMPAKSPGIRGATARTISAVRVVFLAGAVIALGPNWDQGRSLEMDAYRVNGISQIIWASRAVDSIVYTALENVEFIVAVDARYTALAPDRFKAFWQD